MAGNAFAVGLLSCHYRLEIWMGDTTLAWTQNTHFCHGLLVEIGRIESQSVPNPPAEAILRCIEGPRALGRPVLSGSCFYEMVFIGLTK